MSFSYGESRSGGENYSRDKIDPSQTPYLQNMYARANTLAKRGGNESVAGFNPMQTQGFDMAQNYAQNQGQDIFNNTSNALNFGLNAADVDQNPYLQKAMQAAIRPLTQNYQENVLSNVTDEALQAGQFGGSRQGVAEGITGRGYLDKVGDITSSMANQGYNTGLNTMMQSIGQAPNVQNMGLFGANVMQGIGGQQQGLTQAVIDAPWNNVARFRQALGSPTVLGDQYGKTKSRSFDTSASIGGQ